MPRSGEYIKQQHGQLAYETFKPRPLPPVPSIEINDEMDRLIKRAYHLLGMLDGYSKLIPNKNLFLSMYVRKEALLSSQIEGTQATLDDLFDPYLEKNVNADVDEVIRYIQALNRADELLHHLPVSIRLLREIHRVLLESSRGQDKEPGELRNSQNWIGPAGESLKYATYIPPHVSDMHQALSDLEKFIHEDHTYDDMIKIALIHYQFETIHPFLDGNGRIGRLLISILLKEYRLLDEYTLYLSYYLKKNRQEYYDRLMDVRTKGHYEAWIHFFIKGIIDTSEHAIMTLEKILDLRDKNIRLCFSVKGKPHQTILELFHYIEAHPIIDITQTSIALNKSFNTISTAIRWMVEQNILKQIEGHMRYRMFAYVDYLNILKDGLD